MKNNHAIWVDTDFGFDDLWALLLLRHLGVNIAAISLVHGNASIDQVCFNAAASKELYRLDWPMYIGASAPLQRQIQTAGNVLGPTGMQTRGRQLPQPSSMQFLSDDKEAYRVAFSQWLDQPGVHQVLALGPLTNLALLSRNEDIDIAKIDRITWMGGSCGRGNHTAWAEFNAACDPEALAVLIASGVAIDVVDLELCRQVQFDQLPAALSDLKGAGEAQLVLADLLGGYLDIALHRGRTGMNIYDPLAALVCAKTLPVEYRTVHMRVETGDAATAGRTEFAEQPDSPVRLVTAIDPDRSRSLCLAALDLSSQSRINTTCFDVPEG